MRESNSLGNALGWPVATVGELYEVGSGIALGPARKPERKPRGYLRVANVQRGNINLSDIMDVEEMPTDEQRYAVRAGDLLVVEGHANPREIGRCAAVQPGAEGLLHQNHLFRLRGNRILPKLAEALLNSPSSTNYWLTRAGTSSGLYTISRKALLELPLPVIPTANQRSIVEVLDAFTESVESERQSLNKEMLLWEGVLNRELASHIQEYGTKPLRDVCLSGGAYGSNAAAVSSDLSMPRYVRITDIDDHGRLATDATSMVSLPWEGARPYLLADGDLLIARTGFTTGKSYLYRASDGICAYAGYLVRFQVNPERMLPEYAFLWMRGNDFSSWVSQNVREVGQRNISAREYNEHQIAVPPLERQHELVNAWHAARESQSFRQLGVERLHTLRQAVSDDLLSGKVRVQDVA